MKTCNSWQAEFELVEWREMFQMRCFRCYCQKRSGFKQQQVFLFDLIGGYILDVVYIDRLDIQKSLELGTILASTSGRQATLRVSGVFLLNI